MQARYPQILASAVMADRRNYSAHIGASAGDYQGAAESPVAWGRIEDAARGNVAESDGYADVDVRRHDGEWYSVFADPEAFAARRRSAIIDRLRDGRKLTPTQAEALLEGRSTVHATAEAHGLDVDQLRAAVTVALEQLASI